MKTRTNRDYSLISTVCNDISALSELVTSSYWQDDPTLERLVSLHHSYLLLLNPHLPKDGVRFGLIMRAQVQELLSDSTRQHWVLQLRISLNSNGKELSIISLERSLGILTPIESSTATAGTSLT